MIGFGRPDCRGLPNPFTVPKHAPNRSATPPFQNGGVSSTGYPTTSAFDELIGPDGSPRPAAVALVEHLERLGIPELIDRQAAAQRGIERAGITFTVYNESSPNGIDRAWPFDLVPRVIRRTEWDRIEVGLVQRLVALNRFIADVYSDQEIISDGLIPRDLVTESKGYLPACHGAEPAHGVWAHICGSDLVRAADGEMYILEDNLRVPSGVSYLIENRATTKRIFPELFADHSILPVDAYPERLRRILASLAPWTDDPVIVVLTPGIYNSAYFEHAFLARTMGVELVEGRDLCCVDDRLYLHTIDGRVPVDVVYRRVDDLFLDPTELREDSTLGVPGLLGAWRAGTVAVANAPGTGVADDKVVYSYVPEMIRYYLKEEPLLANVPTFRCEDPDERAHVLDHLDELVVKPANESGGYGIVIGPTATTAEIARARRAILDNPRNYVAQPVINLSTVPTLCDGTLQPRHVDLRPFTLLGDESYVTCGGLTRVARIEGSLLVNSSQGGGSKDTWVVDTDPDELDPWSQASEAPQPTPDAPAGAAPPLDPPT